MRSIRKNYEGRVRVRVVGTTGDASPLEYGGVVVFKSQHGHTWEFWDSDGDGDVRPSTEFTVYRADVPDDVFGYHDWVKVADIARTIGADASELRTAGKSKKVMDRVRALEAIVDYHGASELDSYPITLTAKELKARWRKHI